MFLPEEVKRAIFLPSGTIIGTVSATELATMDDPAIQQLLQQSKAWQQQWLLNAKHNGELATELRQEINSIMSQEADRGKELKQTTIRHIPESKLPGHDIKSDTDLGVCDQQQCNSQQAIQYMVQRRTRSWHRNRTEADDSRAERTESALLHIQGHFLCEPESTTRDKRH